MKADSRQSFPRPTHFEPVSQALVKWFLVKYVLGPSLLGTHCQPYTYNHLMGTISHKNHSASDYCATTVVGAVLGFQMRTVPKYSTVSQDYTICHLRHFGDL